LFILPYFHDFIEGTVGFLLAVAANSSTTKTINMKKVLIFLMALSLFAACNNDKGKMGQKKADYREKDDYGSNDEQTDDKSGKDDDSKNEDYTSNDGWAEKDRSKFLADCMTGFEKDQGTGKKICSCVLGKIENKYSSLEEADRRGGEAEGKKMGMECAEEMNISTNQKTNTDEEDNNKDYAGSGWPESEIQAFVTNCVKTAQKKGMEYLDAQSYCDCMQYKLEKIYPNINDSRLRNLNMESPSIKRMVESCLPGN
jgi:hypothetical protein